MAAGHPASQKRWRSTLAHAFIEDKAVKWTTDPLDNQISQFEGLSMAICKNALVAVANFQHYDSARDRKYIIALDVNSGASMLRHEIHQKPLPGGLLIDRSGQIIVAMLDGSVLCLKPE